MSMVPRVNVLLINISTVCILLKNAVVFYIDNHIVTYIHTYLPNSSRRRPVKREEIYQRWLNNSENLLSLMRERHYPLFLLNWFLSFLICVKYQASERGLTVWCASQVLAFSMDRYAASACSNIMWVQPRIFGKMSRVMYFCMHMNWVRPQWL